MEKKPRKTGDGWTIQAVNRPNKELVLKTMLRVWGEQFGFENELVCVKKMEGDHRLFVKV